jgi:hypothetical protein
MSNQPETPEEIQEELKELGIDNDATGSPDLFISGPALKVGAGILVVLLVVGLVTLIY